KNKLINYIDLVLFLMMSYRALATFSRGGVLTALICIMAFLFVLYYKRSHRERSKMVRQIAIISFSMLGIWMLTTILSQGLILYRYTNRDAAGRLEDDLTTGRKELIITELSGFYHNPVIGVGVGKARELRTEETGVVTASHNEVSRLLSEHGLLGL